MTRATPQPRSVHSLRGFVLVLIQLTTDYADNTDGRRKADIQKRNSSTLRASGVSFCLFPMRLFWLQLQRIAGLTLLAASLLLSISGVIWPDWIEAHFGSWGWLVLLALALAVTGAAIHPEISEGVAVGWRNFGEASGGMAGGSSSETTTGGADGF